MKFVLPLLLLFALCSHAAETQTLLATPGNICWGYYWAQAKPAMKIHSGDRVRIQTVSGNPTRLLSAGAKPEAIQPELRAVYEKIPSSERGPGGHILTGAVYIDKAAPGDVLEVRIEKITMDVPYAYNAFGPSGGFLKADFPDKRGMKVIALDRKRNIAMFAPGIEIPLHPFFGSMGIAPPGDVKVNSAPPDVYAGNMDNKELVAGSTLYIPVHQKALYSK